MCGRFALSAPVEHIRKHFNLREELKIKPRFNISPGQKISVIREGEDQTRELAGLHWGLIPFWVKERKGALSMINARAETVADKPAFKAAFKKYRCLVPANGFFEWKKIPGRKKKQPCFIQMHDEGLFAMAGIWSRWTDMASGKVIESCAVITTDANALLADIHDRMPVIIPPAGYSSWLGKKSRPDSLKKMFTPSDPRLMKYFRVSESCNSVLNDSPECIKNIDK